MIANLSGAVNNQMTPGRPRPLGINGRGNVRARNCAVRLSAIEAAKWLLGLLLLATIEIQVVLATQGFLSTNSCFVPLTDIRWEMEIAQWSLFSSARNADFIEWNYHDICDKNRGPLDCDVCTLRLKYRANPSNTE
jgi:hypothetical protein